MDFLSLAEKEKEKRSTVLGLIWPETAHDRRKRARGVGFTQKALAF
jgi:hypothetical protein